MDYEREVARHKDAVYRQMLRLCGNAEDAEDVLVEAIVKGFQKAETLDDPSAFRA
jgi:RNA polymerase sigma-70 factor (ECF subfamily)